MHVYKPKGGNQRPQIKNMRLTMYLSVKNLQKKILIKIYNRLFNLINHNHYWFVNVYFIIIWAKIVSTY